MNYAGIGQRARLAVLRTPNWLQLRRRPETAYFREDVSFHSHGSRCHAWHYQPVAAAGPLPLVVMAHGFGAEMAFRLPAFAARFARRGLAVLAFDYRHFGQSEGQPRQLISHRRQQQDWQAALDYGSTLAGIDPQRIALWGTSFGAGHALATAARNPGMAAMVLHVPLVDVPRCLGRRLGFAATAICHGLRDLAQRSLGLGPHEVPIVTEPGQFGVINEPECEAGYLSLVPAGSAWRNRCPASVLVTSSLYRPIALANRVQCPTLIVKAEQDQLIPGKLILKLMARLPNATLVELPADHFQSYQGAAFEEAAAAECDFLAGELLHADFPAVAARRRAV